MQHYTKNTQSASAWCKECKTFTAHKVSDGRLDKSHCLPCSDKAEAEHQYRLHHPEPGQPVQEELFA
jgi:ribosomal protein L44E